MMGQAGVEPSAAPSTQSASAPAVSAAGPTVDGTVGAKAPSPGDYFGLWVLAPAMVAIVLAIASRQVVPSLALGILTGAVMMCVFLGEHNPIRIVIFAVERYVLGVFIPMPAGGAGKQDFLREFSANAEGYATRLAKGFEHLHVIIFTQFIGGMIGIIEANGGTRGMVARVTHWMRTRKRGQLGALLGGIIIFFDDYANALILGPSMKPVFDKLRLSRAKLAYIVDSTAAPVASLFIGTWLAAEISYLNEALGELGDNKPAFLQKVNGASAFWSSLPYRTYAWLALWIIFVIAITGRDFGPMRKAEQAALDGADESPVGISESNEKAPHWLLGFLPVFVLVAMTVALLSITGYQNCGEELAFDSFGALSKSVQTILGAADSYKSLLYAGLTAVTVAALSTVLSRALPLGKTMEAMTAGMQRIFGAQIILILAWGLSGTTMDLELGRVVSDFLQDQVNSGNFAIPLLPTVIFVAACIISFATGTSWGTMGILCPTTVMVASHLLADLPVEQATPLFYASIGAVLTGAVFGDHCSPISDTTVLSAMTTDCDLTLHVRTQLPYALVTAVVGLLCTDLLDFFLIRHHPEFYNSTWNVYFGTALAAIILLLIVLVVGRKPRLPAISMPVPVGPEPTA